MRGHTITHVTSATYRQHTTLTVEAGAWPTERMHSSARQGATEASRSFAALLDEVERGETVVVTRGGRRLATIGPAAVGNGAEVLALLAHHVDDDFSVDVAAARNAVTSEGPAWPTG